MMKKLTIWDIKECVKKTIQEMSDIKTILKKYEIEEYILKKIDKNYRYAKFLLARINNVFALSSASFFEDEKLNELASLPFLPLSQEKLDQFLQEMIAVQQNWHHEQYLIVNHAKTKKQKQVECTR